MKNINLNYIVRHYSISIATVFTALSIIIGYISAINWSMDVTGNASYAGYLFNYMTIKTIPVIFIILLTMFATPLFLGYAASNHVNLKDHENNKNFYILIITPMLFYIGCFLMVLISNTIWLKANAISILYSFLLSGVISSITIPVLYSYLIKKEGVLIFAYYLLFGITVGDLTIFSMIKASIFFSLKANIFNIFIMLMLPLIFLLLGIYSNIFGMKFVYFSISLIAVSLFIIKVPQNYIISLNNGILKTPTALIDAIKDKSKIKCETISVINKKSYTLFSCGRNKDRLMGEIFYQMDSNDVYKMVASKEKIITRAYCINTTAPTVSKKFLRCVYGFIPSRHIPDSRYEPNSSWSYGN